MGLGLDALLVVLPAASVFFEVDLVVAVLFALEGALAFAVVLAGALAVVALGFALAFGSVVFFSLLAGVGSPMDWIATRV